MAERRGATTHDANDLDLVARAATGDLAAAEAGVARDLLAGCDACATLAADLRAIAAATRELGSAASRAAVSPAPRDFRLSEADAARLRRRGALGLLGFGSPIRGAGGRVRGLGGALAALGLVGLLVSAGAPALLSAGGEAATSELSGGAAAPQPAAGPLKDGATMAAELAPAVGDAAAQTATESPARVADTGRDAGAPAAGGWAILAGGSFIVLVAGLALLLSSRTGRRAGP